MFHRIGTAPKGPAILLLFKEGEMAVSYWDEGWRSSIDECLLSNYYGEPVAWTALPDPNRMSVWGDWMRSLESASE